MRLSEVPTTMQNAMLIHLALVERGRGLGELLPLQATRQFFKEMLMIPIWQSYHTGLINQLVANGWLSEHVAGHGTSFYSLTPAGRVMAEQVIRHAERNTFEFVPQVRSLFDLSEEY